MNGEPMTMKRQSDLAEPYRILGCIPNGAPRRKQAEAKMMAIPAELVAGNEALLLHEARNVIVAVLGRLGTVASNVTADRFHWAIREYLPLGHYERAPNQPISRCDEKQYACRVAHRLMTQASGKFTDLLGGYGSESETDSRAKAIYDLLTQAVT